MQQYRREADGFRLVSIDEQSEEVVHVDTADADPDTGERVRVPAPLISRLALALRFEELSARVGTHGSLEAVTAWCAAQENSKWEAFPCDDLELVNRALTGDNPAAVEVVVASDPKRHDEIRAAMQAAAAAVAIDPI